MPYELISCTVYEDPDSYAISLDTSFGFFTIEDELNIITGDGQIKAEYDFDPGQELIMNPPERAQEGFPPSVSVHAIAFIPDTPLPSELGEYPLPTDKIWYSDSPRNPEEFFSCINEYILDQLNEAYHDD